MRAARSCASDPAGAMLDLPCPTGVPNERPAVLGACPATSHVPRPPLPSRQCYCTVSVSSPRMSSLTACLACIAIGFAGVCSSARSFIYDGKSHRLKGSRALPLLPWLPLLPQCAHGWSGAGYRSQKGIQLVSQPVVMRVVVRVLLWWCGFPKHSGAQRSSLLPLSACGNAQRVRRPEDLKCRERTGSYCSESRLLPCVLMLSRRRPEAVSIVWFTWPALIY